MDAPQVAIWGPCLWRLFHSLAEKSGKRNYHLYDYEEERCWLNLFNSMKRAMPCPNCRQHYKQYLDANKIQPVFSVKGEERRLQLRTWLWQFHNHVRSSKGQDLFVNLDSIEEMYGTYTREQYMEDVRILHEEIRKGMFLRWLVREEMVRALRSLEELWRILT